MVYLPKGTLSFPYTTIGKPPYLVVEPFFHFFRDDPKFGILEDTPEAFLSYVMNRRLEIVFIPSVVYFHPVSQRYYSPFANLCVAVRQRAMSVLLFSKLPLEDLNKKTIEITPETTTSFYLLRILMETWKNLHPEYRRGITQTGDAFLVIGNRALRHKTAAPPAFPYHYDLGELWWEWKKLPFVFALWIQLNDLSDIRLYLAEKMMKESWQKTMLNLESLAPIFAEKHRLPEHIVPEYLRNFQYILGKEEKKGLEEFRNELFRLPDSPLTRYPWKS